MNTVSYFAVFIFGTIIGSFLNVVLYRYNTGRGIGGRSMCFSCKRTLSVVDLVPVLSYIFLGGKCRTCKSKISIQYALVELLTGLLFAGVFAVDVHLIQVSISVFLFDFIYHLIIVSLLVLITVYDLRHKIIPDAFAYAFAVLAIIHLFIGITAGGDIMILSPSGWTMLAGVILAFPFYLLWLVSDGAWMGLGDAKLALGIGWFLGLSAGASAIIFGFWIGAAVSVLILVCLPRRLTMKSEIPFAPFLVIGLLTVFFLGYNIFSHLNLF